uniref:Uncharacterized protein n=1 Tax=Anopheles farauti TaxID=69004 RepID=A0A182QEU2_9DIPT
MGLLCTFVIATVVTIVVANNIISVIGGHVSMLMKPKGNVNSTKEHALRRITLTLPPGSCRNALATLSTNVLEFINVPLARTAVTSNSRSSTSATTSTGQRLTQPERTGKPSHHRCACASSLE